MKRKPQPHNRLSHKGRRADLEARMYLQRLDYNEDVVHTDGQHQERNDFDHDEGEGDAEIAKNPQRGRDGAEHDKDSSNTQ